MEYVNRQTGHIINMANRTIQLPEVMNGQLYVKNRMANSVSVEELNNKGYTAVIYRDNPKELPLSDVFWDGEQAYREPIIGEMLNPEPE